MPWHVIVGRVVSVEVTICVVVTVSVVDVTVSTVTTCDLDGWVEGEWEHSILRHKPVRVNCCGQENHRTVYLYEISTDVRLYVCSRTVIENDRLRDGGQ